MISIIFIQYKNLRRVVWFQVFRSNTNNLFTVIWLYGTVGDRNQGDPKALFLIATTPRCREGRDSFPGLLYFTIDPCLIMLSVKQGGIKCLWYDSTWIEISFNWLISFSLSIN